MLRGGSLGYLRKGCEMTLLTMSSFHAQPRAFVPQILLKKREIMANSSHYKDVCYVSNITYIGKKINRRGIHQYVTSCYLWV